MTKSTASHANKANGANGKSSRRASAPSSFVDDDDDSSDEIQNSEDENEDEKDGSVEMLSIIREFQNLKSRTATTRSNTFQNQKAALYAQARQNAYNAARDGNDYLDKALDKMSQLKSQERSSYKKHLEDFLPLYNANDEAIQFLLGMYPTILQDLVPRRTEEIDAASSMLMSLPADREASRRKLMRNARAQIDEGLENQRVATDASALIKHYKALLLS
ncbi:hypothetical protein PILCRDRAFT_823154 [Piloderma croceum F 1598]|uniref:Uncharacterized protein n=1 Tax=Piloderma croceum (strain F 1598) TaxID=765440 RepID=A0A0C3FIL1_PILCF|nr:hypothetical protein PILCRDRAFT_823154 [Piloderma croceum F 1598]